MSSSHELIRKPLISCCVTFVGTVLYHREKCKVCNISRWDQPLSFLCAPAMALIKYCTLVITTSLLWPSLWHLSTHWSSTAGFQAWTSVHKKHKWALSEHKSQFNPHYWCKHTHNQWHYRHLVADTIMGEFNSLDPSWRRGKQLSD